MLRHSVVVEVAYWRLATEMCAGTCPHLAIKETHPAGGQYDALTFVDSAEPLPLWDAYGPCAGSLPWACA